MITLVEYLETVSSTKLAKTVGVSYDTVNKWGLLKAAPKPDVAFKLIELSQGALSFDTIFMPYVQKKLKIKSSNKKAIQLEFAFMKNKKRKT